jgi:NADH:ubiquinone oxidoreductase subunit 3 (subunit A)
MMQFAKFLLILGVVFLISGGMLYLLSRLGLNFGQFPGNIRFESGNATCVVALGASILLSILLTLVLNVIIRIMYK